MALSCPDDWERIEDDDRSEREDSILAVHPDGFLAELWEREDGQWDVEYVDPAGTRRDGSGTFHDTAHEAFDQLVPHITEVRAERRDKLEQQAERLAVDWPEVVGRYRLKESTASPTNAEYRTRYVQKENFLGKHYGEDRVQVRFYSDTRKYHITDGGSFARKEPAIEKLQEILQERSEKYTEIENEALGNHE